MDFAKMKSDAELLSIKKFSNDFHDSSLGLGSINGYVKKDGRHFAPVKGNESFKSPERSTKNSAGYDFFAPEDVKIPSLWLQFKEFTMDKLIGINDTMNTKKYFKPTLVKTNVKAYMGDDEVLVLYNRSSNPGKKFLILANGVGIIDSDYADNKDNDGNIMFAFWNLSPFSSTIKAGDKIGQGIFQKFLKVADDKATGERVGGIGSTGN